METPKRILSPEERRQRNHDEMTQNILAAAREVMRAQGVADLNLQEIARKVGMRAPSLYNYFPSKIAIYESLFAMGMQLYRQQYELVMEQYGATWQGLEKSMEGYLSFALENPELYQLLFERPVPGFHPSAEGLAEAAKLVEVGRRHTEAAIASGALNSPFSAEVTTNLLIAIMHGLTAQHLANEPQLPSGSGRFGSLIPVFIHLLKKAWQHDSETQKRDD